MQFFSTNYILNVKYILVLSIVVLKLMFITKFKNQIVILLCYLFIEIRSGPEFEPFQDTVPHFFFKGCNHCRYSFLKDLVFGDVSLAHKYSFLVPVADKISISGSESESSPKANTKIQEPHPPEEKKNQCILKISGTVSKKCTLFIL